MEKEQQNINIEMAIARLREAAERKIGRKMSTPKDFDLLSQIIFDETHTNISSSTLKRIWGYLQSDNSPRISTLNVLAQYVGKDSWDKFLDAEAGEDAGLIVENKQTDSGRGEQQRHTLSRTKRTALTVFVVLLLIATGAWLHRCTSAEPEAEMVIDSSLCYYSIPPSGQRVLHKGSDCFKTIEEYLPLFGVENGDTAYFRPVPGLRKVFVWGPEYGHPVWHNEGDSSQLMPTITEYWIPLAGTDSVFTDEYIHLANEKLYYEHLEDDELRITFMRNIVDGFYVFLGIYRMDREQSTKERIVWRRIADHCDLGNLKSIELLRNQPSVVQK